MAPTIRQVANIISGLTATVTKFVRENQGLIVTVAAVAAGIGLIFMKSLAVAWQCCNCEASG